jgi:hypothetical protein
MEDVEIHLKEDGEFDSVGINAMIEEHNNNPEVLEATGSKGSKA